MKLKDKAKKLTKNPGVYIFLDKNRKPLYVGRATSLRNRVSNYFRKQFDERIAEMVSLAGDLKIFKTGSVLETVILEAKLIKKYWPKYNVRERDNRSFVYIVILKEEYPKPIIIRGRELEKAILNNAKVFGPYQSLATAQNVLKIIRRNFPWSNCKPNSGIPCFNFQIGLCPGLCVGKISRREYLKNIKNIILLLSGKRKIKADDSILISREELPSTLKPISRIEGYDISHLSGKETYGSMVVFINGKADNSQYRLFKIKNAPPNDDLRALEEVITRRLRHEEWRSPDIILIDGGRPQILFISRVLKNLHREIPLVGISKLQNDLLVFPIKTKKSFQDLAASSKKILLAVRDEAHRFALKSSRRKRNFISSASTLPGRLRRRI